MSNDDFSFIRSDFKWLDILNFLINALINISQPYQLVNELKY